MDWKHSDFSDLTREILRHTEVNISPNTLKRIFGKISVEEDYLPQQATINALKEYGGYKPPKADQSVQDTEVSQSVQAPQGKPNNSSGFFKKYKVLFSISLIVIICGLLIMVILRQ